MTIKLYERAGMKTYAEESVENLIACAKAVIKNWPTHGLANAVRELEAALKEMEECTAKQHDLRTNGNLRRYRIVNTFDRPCEELIAELRDDGKLYYVNPKFAGRAAFLGMLADESTPVEDFGLTLTMYGDGLLRGKAVRASVATYDDGRPRMWQGAQSFCFYPAKV